MSAVSVCAELLVVAVACSACACMIVCVYRLVCHSVSATVLLSGDSAFYVDVLFKIILRKISIPFYKEISNRILLVVRFDE